MWKFPVGTRGSQTSSSPHGGLTAASLSGHLLSWMPRGRFHRWGHPPERPHPARDSRGSRARSALAPQALPDSSRLFLCSPGTHGLAGRAAPPALRASVKTFGRTGRSACTSDQDFVKGASRSRKNPLLLENQPALRTPNERTGGGQRHVQEAAGPGPPGKAALLPRASQPPRLPGPPVSVFLLRNCMRR